MELSDLTSVYDSQLTDWGCVTMEWLAVAMALSRWQQQIQRHHNLTCKSTTEPFGLARAISLMQYFT